MTLLLPNSWGRPSLGQPAPCPLHSVAAAAQRGGGGRAGGSSSPGGSGSKGGKPRAPSQGAAAPTGGSDKSKPGAGKKARPAAPPPPPAAAKAAGKAGAGPGRGSSGGGFGSAGASGKAQLQLQAPPAQESFITGPVDVELLEELSRTEFTEAPRWDTWSNHVSGEWVGVYSAFTPWAGQPEPVWMDERGKYLETVLTRCLEERGQGLAGGGGQEDLLLRKVARATTPAELKSFVLPVTRPAASQPALSSAQQGGTGGQEEGVEQQEQEEGQEEDEEGASSFEVEALTFNTQGVVAFDGGHYSAGPDYIGVPQFKMLQEEEGEEEGGRGSSGVGAGASLNGNGPEGDDEDEFGDAAVAPAPTTTSIVESCLVDLSTQTRVRVKLTLRVGHDADKDDEVQVEVLRVVLVREHWAGAPGLTTEDDVQRSLARLARVPVLAGSGDAAAAPSTAASEPAGSAAIKQALRSATLLPRADPGAWRGRWSTFTVSATAIEENDLLTGEPVVTWVYQTNEDAQEWHVPDGPPTEEEDEDRGGCIWLPGGVVVAFTMVEAAGDDAEDGGAKQLQARGLRLGMSWALPVGNQVLSVERDYDGKGVLRGVRMSTAVKGRWVGGTM